MKRLLYFIEQQDHLAPTPPSAHPRGAVGPAAGYWYLARKGFESPALHHPCIVSASGLSNFGPCTVPSQFGRESTGCL